MKFLWVLSVFGISLLAVLLVAKCTDTVKDAESPPAILRQAGAFNNGQGVDAAAVQVARRALPNAPLVGNNDASRKPSRDAVFGRCERSDTTPLSGVHVFLLSMHAEEGINSCVDRINRSILSWTERARDHADRSRFLTSRDAFLQIALKRIQKWCKAELLQEAMSGAAGRFGIDGIRPVRTAGDVLVVLTLPPPAFSPLGASVVRKGDPAMRLVYQAGCAISGGIEPKAPAVVIAVRYDAVKRRVAQWVSCHLDKAGRYSRRNVLPGVWMVLGIRGATVSQSDWFRLSEGRAYELPTLKCSNTSSITVRFSNARGAAVDATATIRLSLSALKHPSLPGQHLHWEWNLDVRTCSTLNPVSFERLADGHYKVSMSTGKSRGRGQLATREVRVSGGQRFVDFALSDSAPLLEMILDVMDAVGKPVPEARVTLSCPSVSNDFNLFGKGDDSGVVSINSVPIDKELYIWVSAPNHRRKKFTIKIPRSAAKAGAAYRKSVRL